MEVPESHTNAEFYSAFANAAYGETNEERQEKLAAQDIEGWEIDEEFMEEMRAKYQAEEHYIDASGMDISGGYTPH